jgi:hypothetical protein
MWTQGGNAVVDAAGCAPVEKDLCEWRGGIPVEAGQGGTWRGDAEKQDGGGMEASIRSRIANGRGEARRCEELMDDLVE